MGDKDYLKVEKRMLNIIKNDIEYMNENEDKVDDWVVQILNLLHNFFMQEYPVDWDY